MFDEFFAKAHALLEQGVPFATAIVVRAEKPTSAKPGDKAIVTADGVMHGWIGGSCAQPTVIQEALRAIADGQPRLLRLSTDPAEAARPGLLDLPMTCFSGGTLEIYIEPQRPLPHLLVIGSLPVARALLQLGQAMGYQVTLVDPDAAAGAGKAAAETAVRLVTDLDALAPLLTPRTYVVVATHGNYDELALARVLRAPVAYVGLVASRKRKAAVVDYLRQEGLTAAEIERLVCPAGLDIQAVRGDEIALSIMAQIVQQRRNAPEIDVSAFFNQAQPAPAATATDPVCGMQVTIAGARHVSEWQGERVYFCCAGCKTTFDQNPAAYRRPAPPQVSLGDIQVGE